MAKFKLVSEMHGSTYDTLIKYYNGNVDYYNKMLKKFPTSIVAKVKKYNNKELFNNENEE